MAGKLLETVVIDEQGRVTLPETVRAAAHLAPSMEFAVAVASDGSVILRPLRDPDQAWFWTESWQAKEREVEAEIAAGLGTRYEDGAAFLNALRARYPSDPDADV
jgi:bifunctional DNA-binding transcriptional regulator/antitoxin component of YhaV-PrlF toxin-antitoxin module